MFVYLLCKYKAFNLGLPYLYATSIDHRQIFETLRTRGRRTYVRIKNSRATPGKCLFAIQFHSFENTTVTFG